MRHVVLAACLFLDYCIYEMGYVMGEESWCV